jgi:hypothetical protein
MISSGDITEGVNFILGLFEKENKEKETKFEKRKNNFENCEK